MTEPTSEISEVNNSPTSNDHSGETEQVSVLTESLLNNGPEQTEGEVPEKIVVSVPVLEPLSGGDSENCILPIICDAFNLPVSKKTLKKWFNIILTQEHLENI